MQVLADFLVSHPQLADLDVFLSDTLRKTVHQLLQFYDFILELALAALVLGTIVAVFLNQLPHLQPETIKCFVFLFECLLFAGSDQTELFFEFGYLKLVAAQLVAEGMVLWLILSDHSPVDE